MFTLGFKKIAISSKLMRRAAKKAKELKHKNMFIDNGKALKYHLQWKRFKNQAHIRKMREDGTPTPLTNWLWYIKPKKAGK